MGHYQLILERSMTLNIKWVEVNRPRKINLQQIELHILTFDQTFVFNLWTEA